MSLKLIPREDPEINFKVKPLSGVKRFVNPILSRVTILKKKLAGQLTHLDDIFLHKTTMKMFDFIKNGRSYGYKQISQLIHELERSILCLQRKKKQLVWKEMERGKKKKS